MDIYDSLQVPTLKDEVEKICNNFKIHLQSILDAIGHPRKDNAKYYSWSVMANIPQQQGPLGDCGVWICKFMHDLCKRKPVCNTCDPMGEANKGRSFMSGVFYSKVIIERV